MGSWVQHVFIKFNVISQELYGIIWQNTDSISLEIKNGFIERITNLSHKNGSHEKVSHSSGSAKLNLSLVLKVHYLVVDIVEDWNI